MKTLFLVSAVGLSLFTANGQLPPASPRFEVASVKRAIPRPNPLEAMLGRDPDDDRGFDGGPGTEDPERINYRGVTLNALVARAYNVKSFQISGPGWLTTEQYEILAKVPRATDIGALKLMLQQLLGERFQLSLHREVKVMPVYRLTVAKSGPNLKSSVEELPTYEDDAARMAAVRERSRAMMEASKAEVKRLDPGQNGAGFSLFRATVADLAQKLSSKLDRPVVDTTQLNGRYNFKLTWIEDTAHSPATDSGARPGPALFTAIGEQLGLKLESGRQEFQVLIIDKALKIPTSN
jgi:uncharacterized protein (TIGR03435 family)